MAGIRSSEFGVRRSVVLGGIFLVLYIVATGFLLAARLFIFPSVAVGSFRRVAVGGFCRLSPIPPLKVDTVATSFIHAGSRPF